MGSPLWPYNHNHHHRHHGNYDDDDDDIVNNFVDEDYDSRVLPSSFRLLIIFFYMVIFAKSVAFDNSSRTMIKMLMRRRQGQW